MKKNKNRKRNHYYEPQFGEVIRNAWKLSDQLPTRNLLRDLNKQIHGKGLKDRHPRTNTKGAFGKMSKFNKRLKAQGNN